MYDAHHIIYESIKICRSVFVPDRRPALVLGSSVSVPETASRRWVSSVSCVRPSPTTTLTRALPENTVQPAHVPRARPCRHVTYSSYYLYPYVYLPVPPLSVQNPTTASRVGDLAATTLRGPISRSFPFGVWRDPLLF